MHNVDISCKRKITLLNKVSLDPYYPVAIIFRASLSQRMLLAIGKPNPYESAADVIGSIREQLSGLSLNTPEFPVINNPLMPSIMDQTNAS